MNKEIIINLLTGNLDYTMLRQMSRRSRLAAMLYDDNQIEDMANVLEPKNTTQTNVNANLEPMEQAEFLKKSHKLTEGEYGALLKILARCRATIPPCISAASPCKFIDSSTNYPDTTAGAP